MASFKAKFPALQELFEKKHRGRGPLGPPAGRGLNICILVFDFVRTKEAIKKLFMYHIINALHTASATT